MKRLIALLGTVAVVLWTASCTDQPTAPWAAPTVQLGVTAQPAGSPARSLYAGTSNPGMVYAYDGTSWTALSGNLGFAVLDIIEFQGDLYAAGMVNRYSGPGKIWRHAGGTSWTEVASLDGQVSDLEVWNDDLYAGTAWNGGKLYRYNAATDGFDYLGTVPDTDAGGYRHRWYGIRAMYPWSTTGHLHLGDIGYDVLGRYDGSSLINDAYMGGSCIYDFAEFNGRLYAAAYAGRLLWSSTGIGRSWSDARFSGSYIWEVEAFQGYLYMGNYEGDLSHLNTSHARTIDWSSGSPRYQQVTSMTADGDAVLYFGTGGEAGYRRDLTGTARVFAYDGSTTPVEIFDADGGDTGGTDHAGIQVLFKPLVIEVDIDIKPGSDPNSITLGSKGMIPVAILTTDVFDAADVDPATVTLCNDDGSDTPVATRKNGTLFASLEDVDGDGDLDLSLKFDQPTLEANGDLDASTTESILNGATFGGQPILGSDAVRITPASS